MTAPGSLYHGRVKHRRLRPVGHCFAYRVFSMLIDLDRIGEADRSLRLFSRNRFNLFSFFDRDHGEESDAPVGGRIRAILKDEGFSGEGRLLLLCYPRILGYVFNPLSVYYCHDGAGRLEAIIYEVRNTFGGKHSYLLPVEGAARAVRQAADKVFPVSPFMTMDCRYNFRLTPPDDDIGVAILQTDAEGPIFNASFSGVKEEMTDAALLRAFLRYPLMTLKVIAAIHFEAARLFAKGLRVKMAASAPASPMTVRRPTSRRREDAA